MLNIFGEQREMPIDLIATITTCKRLDYFKQTMDSFLANCLDKDLIKRWVVMDDNSPQSELDEMKRLYPFLEIHKNKSKGHCDSINSLYQIIDSQYVLWLEDDWIITKQGKPITEALDVLQSNRKIKLVGLRGWSCPAAVTPKGTKYQLHDYNRMVGDINICDSHWKGFTLNPSVVDVAAVKQYFPFKPPEFERRMSSHWLGAGYKVAHLDYVKHIGQQSAYKSFAER